MDHQANNKPGAPARAAIHAIHFACGKDEQFAPWRLGRATVVCRLVAAGARNPRLVAVASAHLAPTTRRVVSSGAAALA
eukprot:scaffold5845_cov101-Isochrysis_galbana.AAC.2